MGSARRSLFLAAATAVLLAALLVHPATGVLLATAAVLWVLRARLGGLAAPLGLALLVRAVLVYLHALGLPLPDDSADALGFHAYAADYAAGPVTPPPRGAFLYSWLLSFPYRLLGADPALGEALNVVLQVTAVGLFAASAGHVWDRRAGASVAWLGAVFPSLVLYGVVLMREALILVLMATWTYHTVRGQAESGLHRAPYALAALAGLYVLQQGFTYVAPLAAAWTLMGPFVHRLSARRVVAGVVAAVPIYLALTAFVLESGAVPLDAGEVVAAQEQRQTGRAAYPEWTVFEDDAGPLSLVLVAAARFVLLLLAPLPHWVESLPDAAAFLDGLAYAALVLLGAWSFRRREPDRTLAAVVLLLLAGLAVYAVGTSNYGTGFRHRAKFSLLLMVAAAPALHGLGARIAARLPTRLGVRRAPATRSPRRPRILYLNNDPAGFARQRAPLARAASERFETRVGLPAKRGDPGGFRMWRKGTSPLREWRSIRSVRRFVARQRPDLVHSFTIKPVIYGTMAARRRGIPVVNTITGTGHVFIARGAKAALLRTAVKLLYRQVLDGRGVVTVFQNRDDRDLFLRHGLVAPERTRLVPGSGVDLDEYRPSPLPEDPVVVFPARMLWTKGVGAFVEAAGILRQRGVPARMVLVGDPDPGNPAAIPEERLRAWSRDGVVEWWGHQSDMGSVFQRARVVCLPTEYGEGVPMALLEASACGRPLVATDVPGCRDVVIPGRTGHLVPPRDPTALADALGALLRDPEGAEAMGGEARRHVEAHFDRRRVHALYLALYDEMLEEQDGSPRATPGPEQRTPVPSEQAPPTR